MSIIAKNESYFLMEIIRIPVIVMIKMIPKSLNIRKTNSREVAYPQQFNAIRNNKGEPK